MNAAFAVTMNGRTSSELKPRWAAYVIGRVSDDPGDSGGADEVVPWNGYEARVRANEVLTGSDVQELFLFYCRTGKLPGSYTRREIEL